MVMVITNEKDVSSTDLIQWMKHFNINYIRINENSEHDFIIKKIQVENNNLVCDFSHQGRTFKLKDIKFVHYRRGRLLENYELKMSEEYDDLLNVYLNKELESLNIFFHYSLFKIPNTGNFLRSSLNKLQILDLAREEGLNIPKTIITNCKNELIRFKEANNTIITKSIFEGLSVQQKTDSSYFSFYNYTSRVTTEDIVQMPNLLFPSLFQKEISKKYEIRSFYLDGKIYSMAIFSQKDHKTTVDFRNYNDNYPNRTSPIKLPKYIEKMITSLMTRINLNCGSIDLILDTNNTFYFLEINPVGQYGMVSEPCNYNLNKKIAKHIKLIANG